MLSSSCSHRMTGKTSSRTRCRRMILGLREGALCESSQRHRVQDTRIIHDGELCQPLIAQIQGPGFRNELIQRRFAFFDHLFLWRTLNLSRVAVINAHKQDTHEYRQLREKDTLSEAPQLSHRRPASPIHAQPQLAPTDGEGVAPDAARLAHADRSALSRRSQLAWVCPLRGSTRHSRRRSSAARA